MRIFTTFAILLLMLVSLHAKSNVVAKDGSAILTFQAWKNLRVEEARLVLERMILESQFEKMPVIDRSPGERQAVIRTAVEPVRQGIRPGGGVKTALRPESRIEQARMNLEIAQDLMVNDYLVIYLSQFRSRDAILDVARRMPPEDVADLLMSHQRLSLNQVAEHSVAPSPRVSPKPL